MKEFSFLIVIIIVSVAVVGYISTKFLGDDNPVEEIAEEVIESQTGVDVDLTPNSPEKK